MSGRGEISPIRILEWNPLDSEEFLSYYGPTGKLELYKIVSHNKRSKEAVLSASRDITNISCVEFNPVPSNSLQNIAVGTSFGAVTLLDIHNTSTDFAINNLKKFGRYI